MCQSKKVTAVVNNYACRKCEGNIGEAVDQEEKLCDGVETVREFTYLGDRLLIDRLRYLRREQCVEYSSKMEEDQRF